MGVCRHVEGGIEMCEELERQTQYGILYFTIGIALSLYLSHWVSKFFSEPVIFGGSVCKPPGPNGIQECISYLPAGWLVITFVVTFLTVIVGKNAEAVIDL